MLKNLKNYKLFESREAIISGINKLQSKYRKLGCEVEIAPRYYDSVYLTLIKVPINLRGKGLATLFMEEFINWADSLGVIITLSPSDSEGSSLERLIEFYKRFGFIKNRINHRDSKYVGSMIRYPKNIIT